VTRNELLKIEREAAWIGDAVLALYAREFVLQERGCMDGIWFTHLTSNEFLSAFGNPTSVEARIGNIYRAEGLRAAHQYIEEEFVPLFRKQIAKKVK
jgi:dsRNA-specific ribonuclease